jgi:glycosyltransferase involved in cell wall biosynthesis
MKTKKLILFHVGARDRYVLAKLLTRKRQLAFFFTDYWIEPKSINSLFIGVKGSRRYSSEVSNIISYNFIQILTTFISKKFFRKDIFSAWVTYDRVFTNYVVRKLKKTKLLYSNSVFWGYTNASLEVFIELEASNPNAIRVLNQIDPGIEYYQVLHELRLTKPNVENSSPLFPKFFKDRIIKEWELAHLIVVNSEYSKYCLIKHNVKPEKIFVMPLAYENAIQHKIKTVNYSNPLRVGFVGNLNLVKGFDLFFKGAKKLTNEMRFLAAGSSWLSKDYYDDAIAFIDIRGHLDKESLQLFYNEIDVLCFPSYSDGFGLVQLEAMSFGIPVLASRNCGDVVIDGVNGFIINHNSNDIVSKLKILENRSLLKQMSSNALKRVDDFSMGMLDKRLSEVLSKIETPLKE